MIVVDAFYLVRAQLSVGNAWQNIAMYSVIAVLAKTIFVQHSVLNSRNTQDKTNL